MSGGAGSTAAAWEARVAQVAALVQRAQRIVVLTGAGVSAESGIATFRDAQSGYWKRFDPAMLASPEGFARDPGLVWRWYMERYQGVRQAAPNGAHYALAALQQRAPSLLLVTQNVDDLHERAGSRHVQRLHGSLASFRCSVCEAPHGLTPEDVGAALPPPCALCGAAVRPGVVWFGELLPEAVLESVWAATRTCTLFLVVGTSGVVMPAAALLDLARARGATVVEVNPERSEITARVHHFLQGRAGVVLPALLQAMDA